MSFLAVALLAAAVAQPRASDSIPLFDDLGTHHLAISTTSALAQRYFDQGLRLVYAFNHPDAIRSFRQAQRLDPSCAMCFWGEALALGPNINVPMDSASGVRALDAVRRAQALAAAAGTRDRDYIMALGTRYDTGRQALRAQLDSAYARAMTSLSRRYPRDDDVATLRAEAHMLLKPWDYWAAGRKAKAHGAVAVAALEPVIARNPRHAGACHFFIHAVEAAYPERAVPCAERLPALMPGAGHVVHMPAHIYIRVGRYADAIDRNVHALHADAKHIDDMAPDGVYRLALHPHNGHFLSFAAAMIGRSAQAMEAARLTRAKTDTAMLRAAGFGALQHYYMLPLFTMVRFGQWDAVLAEPEPAEDLIYPRALRHYARARAYTAQRALGAAEREVASLRALRADPRLLGVTIWDLNPMSALVDIGLDIASGDLASARGDKVTAIARLQAAVEKEDALTYDEPPPWHVPARQELGALLLRAGRAAAAEAVYRRDLKRHPGNGWSLYGLAASLDAQGRRAAAAEARRRFQRSWSTADIELPVGSAADK